MKRRSILSAILAAALGGVLLQPVHASAGEVKVFAAASLKNALDGVAKEWKAETGNDAQLTYAASSALAKQVEGGAPADLFVSADLKWMDYLQKAGLIKEQTRKNLLGNALVMVAPADKAKDIAIDKGFDLAGALAGGRLAVGAVESVPAGIYAKQALTNLGVWDGVKDKLAESENVRAALLLVSRGEAPLGIVYMTDSKADKGVKVVGTFPESSHDSIIYPVAEVKTSANPLAAEFEAYLQSKKAADIFTAQGFAVLSGK